MDHVVLPILEEYKPDIIINSAGQDNHYTDPLTNMNFSAQGYAQLNSKLDPDIAILEGGYSIEGALPYVNLGIVLAMAGLDYSHVREPDYNEEGLKQDKRTSEYIKELSRHVYKRWENREELWAKNIKGRENVILKRQVYYDTDGILETQRQNFIVCNKCSGLNTIDSQSDSGYHIYAITIPRDGCPNCLDQGYRIYKNASPGAYTDVYLQDRINDHYCAK